MREDRKTVLPLFCLLKARGERVINQYYQKLIESEPLGFIDPLTDLGDFDEIQMTFKEPISCLTNRYSGKPYNSYWQKKIAEMRILYIQYQVSLREDEHADRYFKRIRSTQLRKEAEDIVTTYLILGFGFRDIERKTTISYRTLRRYWKRSNYIRMVEPKFYSKIDLTEGYYLPGTSLPKSMKVN